MVTTVAVLGTLVLVLLGALVVWSLPGQPRPFVDASGEPVEGSISEKVFVRVNGVEQGMVIKGRDRRNPVLLYLHGGMPDYFLTQDYPTGLEEQFTVVWWDQRGQGLSFHPDIPTDTMTPDQLVDDTIELTNYLRERFGQDKIYLMGHSGGTFVGIQAVERSPELYHAYIAVAQMTHQIESERIAHAYMLERYRSEGNEKMARKLEQAPVSGPPMPTAWSNVRDVAMHDQGVGTCRDMRSIVTGLLLRSLRFRESTLAEKIALWRGKIFSGRLMWNQMLGLDIRQEVTRLEVPVYFFHGVHDYTVNYSLAREYFDELEAPAKGFYTFEESAHSPIFEEPERVREIVETDVFGGRTGLADAR
jgi:pimeloyl-ACP methyl ester carboxylesterase